MEKIKLYTDVLKVKEAPKWGYVFPLVEYLVKENKNLLEYYEIVTKVQDADFLALPLSVEYLLQNGQQKYYEDFLALAKKEHKKLLVFTAGDIGKTIHEADVITIRLGGFKSKLPENTFIMPPFIEDPLKKFQLEFRLLPYEEKPSIGFVGHSAKGIRKWIKEGIVFLKGNIKRLLGKEATDFQLFYPSSIKRFHYLMELKSKSKLKTDFIFREKYRAGIQTEEDRKRTSLEFFRNIQQNPYTFCLRGAGNFSVRFYETLAMGRIPVFVDTDCQLPYSESIDWNKQAVIVDAGAFESIEEKIANFHKQLEGDRFQQIQSENRAIWEQYFTKEGYFSNFQQELKKQV